MLYSNDKESDPESVAETSYADLSQAGADLGWTPRRMGAALSGGSSDDGDGVDEEKGQESFLEIFNEAMSKLSGKTFSPLTFQLNCSWEDATNDDKELCLEKAEEACRLVCSIIAPKDGSRLFEEILNQQSHVEVSEDLKALMTAFGNAPTRRIKIQILSIYAHRYPIKTLIKLHEPYAVITKWQINQARIHAQQHGPGVAQETAKRHRVRVDRIKLDHFIDFIHRSHFYQDVAYGVRVLRLDSGEQVEMPNIVRVVTRSTMVALYMKYCQEVSFISPLSRRTMFRILEVCEASQRTSLRGLDNIAADGALGFNTLECIVKKLEEAGAEKDWVTETMNRLQSAKLYLRVTYPAHCSVKSSLCKDHCVNFALSDPKEDCFQTKCDHDHIMKCSQCEDLKQVLIDVEDMIYMVFSSTQMQEQMEDMLHDLKQSSKDILSWKAHILRSIHQDMAKEDILDKLDESTALIVMDWAMKYLPTRYREKQSQWFGKRGLSWHVSSVISKEASKLRTQSFVHLFNNCNQDWFSVTSILEHLINTVREDKPNISSVYLRSDEGGCYHSNMLIAACQDVSRLTGVKILAYHFSEPGHGKDICDRIICPMKLALKTYCNEGNDIVTASDMRKALEARKVRGTTACVGKVDETKNSLEMKKLDNFSKFHNFEFEDTGIRMWKAYKIGEGKLIKNDEIYTTHIERSTLLEIAEEQDFFVNDAVRELDINAHSASDTTSNFRMYECTKAGCKESFASVDELELHLDVGTHQRSSKEEESLYDTIRRDWADKFSNIRNMKIPGGSKSVRESLFFGESSEVSRGWALQLSASSARFPDNVRDYLERKFNEGERTGNKADPVEVEAEMRRQRKDDGSRVFARNEWLKASQIKGFFSRHAASLRRKNQASSADEITEEEMCEIESEQAQEELLLSVMNDIGLSHPIICGDYNICRYISEGKLYKLTVPILKEILTFLEVDFNKYSKKRDLTSMVEKVAKECSCFGNEA